MKTTLLSIALLMLFRLATFAQSPYSVKGSAVDTTEKKSLSNATVMVLNAKDSILQKFTRVSANGAFTVNDLDKGKFILLISYPGYADYSESFTLDAANPVHNFGKIGMLLKARLLQDVIVKGTVTAIKIKGDTTEFNAKAYVIQPNDRVEDLIKQFPGIQVDKDGKITAQGKSVDKVLVDGEEFFGDDPTLVTKNIRADMVDKVQLYDKKSDQATFTGIDDGQKIKTLNIKLKDDKKNGYFGKLDAGVATRGYYQGQGMYNQFTAKQKFSAYTTDGNTGKTGLSWQDNSKYGDAAGVTVDDNGGISIFFSGGDNGLDSFDGRYDGRGIPLAKTGGLHYDTKWSKDNETLNANYKVGQLDVNGTSSSLTQNNLKGDETNSNSNQTFKNSMFREKADFTYLVKFDTTQTLKIAVDGTYRHGKTATDYMTENRRGPIANDTLLSRNHRNITNDNEVHQFNASAFYTKKLKKKGRTLSILFSEAINNNESNGYLKSEADFYHNTGALDSTQIIDQHKTNTVKNTVFNSNITYTEPLSKTLSLIFNYGFNVNEGSADMRSYNQSAPGIYNVLDPTVSNFYKLNQTSNQIGAILNYKKGKGTVNFGTKASDVAFKQIDEYTGDVFKRHFINWNPQANFQYRFSQQAGLYLNYNGNTTQPSINQIQPVKVNTDPFNVYLGNQALKPSFRNSLNFNYYSYKVLSEQNLYMGGSFSTVSNQIVNSTITDLTSGKSTIQYVNLAGKTSTNMNVYGSFGRKIDALGFNVGLNANAAAYTNYTYINSALARSNSGVYGGSLYINKYEAKKYDFYLSAGPTYNISKSDLQPIGNNFRGFNANGNFNVYLPLKFQIGSNLNYSYQGPSATFAQSQIKTIWNANISKTVLKDNTLKFSLSGNDLLNQNIGFYRSTIGNVISQNSYVTIQRYFMFSVTWDFNKMGGTPAKK